MEADSPETPASAGSGPDRRLEEEAWRTGDQGSDREPGLDTRC